MSEHDWLTPQLIADQVGLLHRTRTSGFSNVDELTNVFIEYLVQFHLKCPVSFSEFGNELLSVRMIFGH